MPSAIKVFLWALFSGTTGAAVAFKLITYFGNQWAGPDEERLILVAIGAVLGSLAVGVSSAVAAGVMVGKRQR